MVFANTPSSECLQKNVPNTEWAWIRAQLSVGGGVYEGWSDLRACIKTGNTAFDQVLGCGFWEYYRRNPEADTIFNEAMCMIGKHTSPQGRAGIRLDRFPVIAELVAGMAACWWIFLTFIRHAGVSCSTSQDDTTSDLS
jgi:hypothetical protein